MHDVSVLPTIFKTQYRGGDADDFFVILHNVV